MTGAGPVPPARATFRSVFAVREFRALWLSEVLSAAGDRLALVALVWLVYERTRSPLLAAAAYAAGYLPWVIGNFFAANVADRYPRRAVMVACGSARAVLVGAMIVPDVPLRALVVLLFVATMFTPASRSARAAIMPDILIGDEYMLGTAMLHTAYMAAQVAGTIAGGFAVAVLGMRFSLAIDVAVFMASGLLIGLGIRARPAAAVPRVAGSRPARAGAGLRLVFGDRMLRTPMLLGWLVAFYTVPEGVAAPYAARLGGGPAAIGLVLASTSLATTVCVPLFCRLVSPRRRIAWMGPLATATCAALALAAFRPGLAVSVVIFSVSAAFGAYQIAANTAFVVHVPNERRAQAFGIASTGIVAVQGAAFVAAGAAAEVVTPAVVIAGAGGIGTAAAFMLTLTCRRLYSPRASADAVDPRHPAAKRIAPSAAACSPPLSAYCLLPSGSGTPKNTGRSYGSSPGLELAAAHSCGMRSASSAAPPRWASRCDRRAAKARHREDHPEACGQDGGRDAPRRPHRTARYARAGGRSLPRCARIAGDLLDRQQRRSLREGQQDNARQTR